MPKWRVHGRVTGSIYMGEFEAETEAEALQKAADEHPGVALCHECAGSCEDPEVEATEAERIS